MDGGLITEIGRPADLKTSLQVLDSSSEPASLGAKTDVKLIGNEDRELGKVSMSVYMTYFRYAGGCFVMLSAVLAMFLWMIFRFWSDYTLKNWSESDASESNLKYMGPYMLLGLIAGLFIFLRALIIALSGVKAASLLQRLVKAPISLFFDITPLGRVLNRVSKDTNDIDGTIVLSLSGALQCLRLCARRCFTCYG